MSSMVGKVAPDFKAKAVVNGKVVNDFTLSQFIGKKYVILFFYPKDFSPVCPTEIVGFQNSLKDFEARDVQIIACSTDTDYCHLAWINTPRDKFGAEGVTYPLVSDVNKTISESYGVLADNLPEKIAYRGLFLIDKKGIVRHEVVNDLPIMRSTEEELRMVDVLQHFEQFGEVCPLNWRKGK